MLQYQDSYMTISLIKLLLNDLTYRDFENTLPSRAGYYFLLYTVAYY